MKQQQVFKLVSLTAHYVKHFSGFSFLRRQLQSKLFRSIFDAANFQNKPRREISLFIENHNRIMFGSSRGIVTALN
jgi:hypothetical protein